MVAVSLPVSGTATDVDRRSGLNRQGADDAGANHAELDVVILGGGFGGLLTGICLARQGVTDVRILDHAGDFAGTGFWDRFPDVRADVGSYVELRLLEEAGCLPIRRYADGAQMLEYARQIGRHFDLYRAAQFGTSVVSAVWSQRAGRWEIRTADGDVLNARFVVRTDGPLNEPEFPGVPGIVEFRGAMVHTSRWDHDRTCGNRSDLMADLGDLRVAVIGAPAAGPRAESFRAELRDTVPALRVAAAPAAVEKLTETGVLVDGTHHEVDCIVFATGANHGSPAAYGYDIIGRGGRSMRAISWNSPTAGQGFFSAGYPNFIELGLTQDGYVVNLTVTLDHKARYAARVIGHALDRGVTAVEPDDTAHVDCVERRREARLARSAYLAMRGPARHAAAAVHPELLEKWWQVGTFDGLRLT